MGSPLQRKRGKYAWNHEIPTLLQGREMLIPSSSILQGLRESLEPRRRSAHLFDLQNGSTSNATAIAEAVQV
jgi:hypothetical protein